MRKGDFLKTLNFMSADTNSRFPEELESALDCTLVDERGDPLAQGKMFQPPGRPVIFCINHGTAKQDKLLRGVALKRDGMTVRGSVSKVGTEERPWGQHLQFEVRK